MPSPEPDLVEVERAVRELLLEEEVGTLATVDADGYPSAATMHFAADGLAVYLHTFTYTRKYAHIKSDPKVSYALAHLPPEGFAGALKVRALQVTGRASIVTDPEEIDRAVWLSHQQFDWLKETTMYDNFKRANRADRQVFVRVDPISGMWTDNRVRMLWRRLLSFTPDGRNIAEIAPYDDAGGEIGIGAVAAQ